MSDKIPSYYTTYTPFKEVDWVNKIHGIRQKYEDIMNTINAFQMEYVNDRKGVQKTLLFTEVFEANTEHLASVGEYLSKIEQELLFELSSKNSLAISKTREKKGLYNSLMAGNNPLDTSEHPLVLRKLFV